MIIWASLGTALKGFEGVANNLRESFRALAGGRPLGSVAELPGVSIASLGVKFQMFNAAFLSSPVETDIELEERLHMARVYFASHEQRWAFWICEDWLQTGSVRRKLSRYCENVGLRLTSELPGMAAEGLRKPSRELPALEIRRVDSETILNDFRAVGASCFHVPIAWFSEVFDTTLLADHPFACWVGYRDSEPVATAATIFAEGAIGLYNVATVPSCRHHGYAESITRKAIEKAARHCGSGSMVLQSTSDGYRLYSRIGFEPVTRVLVYNSVP